MTDQVNEVVADRLRAVYVEAHDAEEASLEATGHAFDPYLPVDAGIRAVLREVQARPSRGETMNELFGDSEQLTHPSRGVVDVAMVERAMNADAEEYGASIPASRVRRILEAAALPAVPEVPKDAPLTATALAEALSCFWNAAIGSQSVQYDPTARAVAGAMAEGLAAVEHRLRELPATPAHDQPEGSDNG